MWWLTSKKRKENKWPKILFWTHGWYGRENIIQTWIKKSYLSRIDGFLLYNERAKRIMIDLGFSESKLHVIYNSLDYNRQLIERQLLKKEPIIFEHFKNKNKNIIFIGRLISTKQLNLILYAIAKLKKIGEYYNIIFIGDGPEKEKLRKLAKSLGVIDNIWFYGESYNETINAKLIYNSDLCVSPGNIGLTCIHVMMYGCPVITNNDYNNQGPEFEAIKEGVTGDFFIKNDVDSLVNCINNWFQTKKNERDKIRFACYNEIDKYWNPKYQLSILKSVLT